MSNTNSSDENNNFCEATVKVASFIQCGDIESAVRLSGELLAECDGRLRQSFVDKKEPNTEKESFVEAASLHVYCLRLSRMADEALMCVIGCLLTLEIYHLASSVNPIEKVRLYDFAVRSAIDSFERNGDAIDETTESHRGYILSYLASLLYHNYRKAVDNGCEANVLTEVYPFLKAISASGAIQSPTIRLGEKEVNPDDAGPLLVDIMGRAAALGIGN